MSSLEELPITVLSELTKFATHKDIINMFAASSAMKNSIGELEGQIRKRLKPKVVVFRNSEMFEQFVTNVKFSPFTSFQFCFDPMEHTSLDQFLEQHGEKILRLTLPNVYLFMEDLERQFYERMPHLEELVVDRVKLWRKGFPIVLPNYEAKEQSLKGNVPINTTTCPGSFKTLRSFQFENACEPSVVLMFLMVLPKLKILRMGDIDRNYFFEEWTETDNGNYERLVLTKYLEFLSNGEPANKLKVLSLGNEMRDAEHMSDQEIARFIRAINQQHVLVQKVTCTLVNLVWMSNELEEEEKKLFLDSVDNLIDFSPEVSGLVFKSLKSFECLMGNWEFGNFNENFQHPQVTNWSKVEFLSVKLSFSDSNGDDVPGRIGSFLSFVFGIVRPSVKCVQIELDTADESVQMVFNPFAIAYNFPFMESLILKIPYYTSNDFCTLMQNVAENALVLKYLDLTFARSVSSRIFLGTDPNMFTIFKMKELKHLRIAYDPYPEYVQTFEKDQEIDLMKDVISRIPLTCLVISCRLSKSIFKKTPERAQAFLDGPIGKSLLYLDWKSHNEPDLEVFQLLTARVQHNRRCIINPSAGKVGTRYCQCCQKHLAECFGIDTFHKPTFY